MYWTVMALSVVLLAGEATTQDPNRVGPRADHDLFRRALDAKREVVVVRGPSVAPHVLQGLIDTRLDIDRWSALYSVRVELRSADQPPLVLASRLGGTGGTVALEVLDLLVERGTISLAVAEGSIGVWQVRLPPFSDDRFTYLQEGQWNPRAVGRPADRRNVQVSLARSAQGRLTVEVVDLADGSARHQHTLFEQVNDQREFQRIRQWVTDVTTIPDDAAPSGK